MITFDVDGTDGADEDDDDGRDVSFSFHNQFQIYISYFLTHQS